MERVIIHNQKIRRFETVEDGITGYVEYEEYSGGLEITHTIVPKQIGGRGVAADLVKFVLDYAVKNNLKIVPTCSYVKIYIERHMREYGALQDVVANKFPSVGGMTGHSCGVKGPNKD